MHETWERAEKQAHHLRHALTYTERLLWKLLRDRRLEGLKFRRQVAVGPYIADFVCFAKRLIVEADGPLHEPAADKARDAWLRSQRFEVLRFANDDIALYPNEVLDRIRLLAGLAPPHPTGCRPPPSPARGEGL
jgi:very-short-patch-repair endonuclease